MDVVPSSATKRAGGLIEIDSFHLFGSFLSGLVVRLRPELSRTAMMTSAIFAGMVTNLFLSLGEWMKG